MAMTELQHLLCKLAEEAGEVAQMAMKCQQFGLDETYIDASNKERLHSELSDLMVIVDRLNEHYNLEYFGPSTNYLKHKNEKINRYLRHSKELGMVD